MRYLYSIHTETNECANLIFDLNNLGDIFVKIETIFSRFIFIE